MLYSCNSCGASMVYDPERRALVCPQCGSERDSMPEGTSSMKMECPNCGAAFEGAERKLVYQCPYCSSWVSVDANLAAGNAPVKITPFTFGKKAAREKIKDAFDRIPCLPDSLLREQEGNDIDALYAPFWLYTMEGTGRYDYTGEIQNSSHMGLTTVTEHKVYDIHRVINYCYRAIPVDAMDKLDDRTIDAALPYDRSLAKDMDPIYLAGTESFLPDREKDEEGYISRAKKWALESVDDREDSLTTKYKSLKIKNHERTMENNPEKTEGVLLPVYRYEYKGFGTHRIYMNGTTGRMSGNAPCDKKKVVFHYLVEAACTVISAAAIVGMLGVLL